MQGCVLFGFPRSGTTLLARLLDAHPAISCPPETQMFSAAGRFLAEQVAVEGPPIGICTGLGFLGLDEADILRPLREMLFGFHHRIGGDADVWVEKSATDIFHLEVLRPLLSGHVKFIALTRNPLDVVASNMDLAEVMGAQLPELFALTRGVNGPHEGIARAWIDRQMALDAFVTAEAEHCFSLRYEDLLAAPEETLGRIVGFLGLSGHDTDGEGTAATMIREAFASPSRVGLGDFRVHETAGIRPPVKDGWRKRLPRAAAARIVPALAPLMETHGYGVPKLPPVPDRKAAIRQFTMSVEMKRRMGATGPE